MQRQTSFVRVTNSCCRLYSIVVTPKVEDPYDDGKMREQLGRVLLAS